MRIVTLLLVAAALPASAQVNVLRVPGGFASNFGVGFNDASRVAIGVTTSSSATSRDTIGVLVTSVQSGSPADKAGIGEGDRISAINGVSLKLAAADIAEYEVASAMTRRLTRELNKLKAGDEVELHVYSNGQNKTVRVRTVSPDDLYASLTPRRDSDRATLGLNLGTTGSSRDTIGVFVMSVTDGGPAAKAGIEEGSRIASINGVDVRGRREVEDDEYILRTANVSRLEREIAKINPGDDVDLRIFYNGQYKNVKVKSTRTIDLPRRNRSITILGGDTFAGPLPEIVSRIPIDIGRMTSSGMGRAFGRVSIAGGNRVVW
ncbi:MAG TPA: PDZ domain-containing protein [Gemmatimonadaceae bacterium]|jgi:S1-C subfamily serine protease